MMLGDMDVVVYRMDAGGNRAYVKSAGEKVVYTNRKHAAQRLDKWRAGSVVQKLEVKEGCVFSMELVSKNSY